MTFSLNDPNIAQFYGIEEAEQAIIHRHLEPANIKVPDDGTVNSSATEACCSLFF